MNERIQELKHQASLWCDRNIPEQYSEETNSYGSAWEDKFAELLITALSDKVSRMVKMNKGYIPQGPYSVGWNAAVEYASKELKGYYGVEE